MTIHKEYLLELQRDKPNGFPSLDVNGDLTYPPLHKVMSFEDLSSYTPKIGEIVQQSLTNTLFIGDGTTLGGRFFYDPWQSHALSNEVDSESTSPIKVADLLKTSVTRETAFSLVIETEGGSSNALESIHLYRFKTPPRSIFSGVLTSLPVGSCVFGAGDTINETEFVGLGLTEVQDADNTYLYPPSGMPDKKYIFVRGTALSRAQTNAPAINVVPEGTYWLKVISDESSVPCSAVSSRRVAK